MRVISRAIIALLIFSIVAPVIQAPVAAESSYIIFRAYISPLYIENTSVIMKVLGIELRGNKPISSTITVHYDVKAVEGDYEASGEQAIQSGRETLIYLPALLQGHYTIKIYAQHEQLTSRKTEQDFAVSPAPIPYSLSISSDGSFISFHSLKLNETSVPDTNYPFRMEIYSYETHGGEALVTTYDNLTCLNISIPAEWKRGILIVEIVDVNGWRNGASVDLANFQFQGRPLQYDYQYTMREPYASHRLYYVLGAFIMIIMMYFAALRIQKRVG